MKKKLKLLITISASFLSYIVYGQNGEWKHLPDFPGGKRLGVFAFSIGKNFYIGCGADSTGPRDDFWEFNSLTNKWTKKASFPGGGRYLGTSFSIGNLGYAGIGTKDTSFAINENDFYSYNPLNDKWTRISDFGGGPRILATGVSIGLYGYITTGLAGDGISGFKNDTWQYDPAADKWTKKAIFPGTPRFGCFGFALNDEFYVGTGFDLLGSYKKDFYKYNPVLNKWTKKSNYPGPGLYKGTTFTIGQEAYAGLGFNKENNIPSYNDSFWKYNYNQDTWTFSSVFSGKSRFGAGGASDGKSGYIFTGFSYNNYLADIWQFQPTSSLKVFNTKNTSFLSDKIVNIWPNPSSKFCNIQINTGINFTKAHIDLYSSNGKRVYTSQPFINNVTSTYTLPLDNYSNGIYCVVVKIGNETIRRNLTIMK